MIYLDYAATTPLSDSVIETMKPYFDGRFGNASSVHTFGREARMSIERARNGIASALRVEQGEILFMGSATEANNLVVKGVVEKVRDGVLQGKFAGFAQNDLPEVIVSAIEHPCVMEAARHLERLGWAKIHWLAVDSDGRVIIDDLAKAISDKTVLVSLMYVNNEIGSVQPVREIGETVRHARRERLKTGSPLPLYFHTDAVQAVQYFDCKPGLLGVDLMTLAPHKCYGPKGIGVLYKNQQVLLTRQIDGGGQEYYQRAGTENLSLIEGASVALIDSFDSASQGVESQRLFALQQQLCETITQTVDQIYIVGTTDKRAPHIVNIIVKNCDSEALIASLDRQGFAVSSGSACSSGVVKTSHVIDALGLGIEHYAPVRVSMGKETSSDEISLFCRALVSSVTTIRNLGV